MLTLFAIPKAFTGHISIIQRNAIQSWTLLRPQCEIVLFGDDAGTKDVAKDFEVKHVPHVARNELGTPLLNDMFETAQRIANHELLCFVNSDIILMSDFVRAVDRVRRWRGNFLMIGRRSDVRITEPLDFAQPDWE
ncbi:MAG TPA: glycosyl transferase family 2, partial [Candidatus Eisenbacteria bacterium]|nr:glycosyl transferase family 2 [Candidatus Eisenbacteria bacterium]